MNADKIAVTAGPQRAGGRCRIQPRSKLKTGRKYASEFGGSTGSAVGRRAAAGGRTDVKFRSEIFEITTGGDERRP
ncbi:hypothetical protein EVAR_53879_1 [Eumeta japonica]|uniref:Uncharacterized protein n=1 Tax=Eumeta variegata TaxID=151549 RepID=A0A4C1XDV8_EUMVA|nr:hypothetical protein EVAR_53879_1 [Eumeta japonica]